MPKSTLRGCEAARLRGCEAARLRGCEAALKIKLPQEYKSFLRMSNRFNNEISKEYLVLWSAGELAVADGYELFKFQTERFLVGSNGGPTAYGIVGNDYISIPFVFAGPWQDEVRVLGQSFDAFVAAIEGGLGS